MFKYHGNYDRLLLIFKGAHQLSQLEKNKKIGNDIAFKTIIYNIKCFDNVFVKILFRCTLLLVDLPFCVIATLTNSLLTCDNHSVELCMMCPMASDP